MIPHTVRLLVLTTSFPTRLNPAAGVFVRRLLENLPGGYAATVLTPDTTGADGFVPAKAIQTRPFRYAPRKRQTQAHQPGGLPVVLRQKSGDLVFLACLCLAAGLATLRRARQADIIHAHWASSGLLAGLAGFLANRPVVTTLRGTDHAWACRSSLFRLLMRCCLSLNRRVITVSREMARQLTSWFPAQGHKVLFIPNGVEIARHGPGQVPANRLCVAVIGNLIPGKRVDVIIRAMARLARSMPEARLLVVGDGPQRGSLEALTHRLALDKRVVFLGVQAPERVPQILRSCNALVLASESEGRPNIVLEAMAAGVPLIASDIPAVRELIGHNARGLLFPVGDVDCLVSRLKMLWENPGVGRNLVANASKWLQEQELTWEQTAARYAAVYREVMQEHHRGKRPCVA